MSRSVRNNGLEAVNSVQFHGKPRLSPGMRRINLRLLNSIFAFAADIVRSLRTRRRRRRFRYFSFFLKTGKTNLVAERLGAESIESTEQGHQHGLNLDWKNQRETDNKFEGEILLCDQIVDDWLRIEKLGIKGWYLYREGNNWILRREGFQEISGIYMKKEVSNLVRGDASWKPKETGTKLRVSKGAWSQMANWKLLKPDPAGGGEVRTWPVLESFSASAKSNHELR